MAYQQQLYISPTTLTDLTVTIEYDNQEIPSKTATLNDFSIVNDELKTSFALLDDCTVTIQSQGYETEILNITTEYYEDKHIVLTPLLDYFSKVSNGTDTYFVKAEVIKNQQNNSSLKYWTGTKAQYDAIATKDSDTIYNVEDTTSPIVDILNTLYPIGAIYIGTMATCPLSVLGVGTWQLVATDRVLQGAGTNSVGTTVEAGLPNITGRLKYELRGSSSWSTTQGANGIGALDGQKQGTYDLGDSSSGMSGNVITFDASRSSSIYGNSNTVQPPAYIVNIWERTA